MFDELFVNEQDDTLAQQAARALTVISEGDGEGVMSKKNHAVIRVSSWFDRVWPDLRTLILARTPSSFSTSRSSLTLSYLKLSRAIPSTRVRELTWATCAD